MRYAALALPLLGLAACGQEPEPQAEATPSPTPTLVGPRTLIAAGFDPATLGPRMVGPDGPEVTSEVSFDDRAIAQVVSYVACALPEADGEGEASPAPAAPADDSGCDIAAQPAGAAYTYVHRVIPGDGADGPVVAFRTSRRAGGFANTIGFSREEAQAALGEGYRIGVSIDNGQLIWRIEAGDGWTAGEPITLFWQSEYPPEGPAEAYEVETAEGRARATGPWPPASMEPPEGIENIPG